MACSKAFTVRKAALAALVSVQVGAVGTLAAHATTHGGHSAVAMFRTGSGDQQLSRLPPFAKRPSSSSIIARELAKSLMGTAKS